MTEILNYEPKLLWKHFNEIRKIPHCSKHEEKVREYVLDFAKRRDLAANADDAGNVVISKPASPGFENKPILVLQGHLDMVCEKNSDKDFDFSTDSIELLIEDEWLTADGTSLGSDNAIGIATTLAILEDNSLKLGAIEGLFTVDEETGLTGAFQLNSDFLIGRTLLNLDSEEEGAIYVGCAGGGDTLIKLPLTVSEALAGYDSILMKVTGLRGGHSGIDIQEQRGNAIKIIARLLTRTRSNVEFHIGEFTGGSKRNAIPRETFVKISIKSDDIENFKSEIKDEEEIIQCEIKPIDPDFKVIINPIESIPKILSTEIQDKLLNLLNGLPHGVLAMNFDIPDLVETSTNLATVNFQGDSIEIGMSTRSSMTSQLEAERSSIRSIAMLCGAKVIEKPPYPGWKPNLDSMILKVAKKTYQDMSGKDPEIKAIHAGLECGIIGEKFKGMDMVSIGPDIKHPHSPEEKVHIGSVQRFYELVLKILDNIN